VRQASTRIHELHTLCERLRTDLKRVQTSLNACEAERDALRTQLQDADAQTMAYHAERNALMGQTDRIKELETALRTGQMKQTALTAENEILRNELELRDGAISDSFAGVSDKLTRAERDIEEVYTRLHTCMQDKESACAGQHTARSEANMYREASIRLLSKLQTAREALGRSKVAYSCVPAYHIHRQLLDTTTRAMDEEALVLMSTHPSHHHHHDRWGATHRATTTTASSSSHRRSVSEDVVLRVTFLLWKMSASQRAPKSRAAAHVLHKQRVANVRRVMHTWCRYASDRRTLTRRGARCVRMNVHMHLRRIMRQWRAAAKWQAGVYRAEECVEERQEAAVRRCEFVLCVFMCGLCSVRCNYKNVCMCVENRGMAGGCIPR
jgi:hypothetical protein